ncbi:MAG: nitric oxide reductase NorD protein [Acidimicrobiaceae bacterium]|nr:nitric oxide reductase NorD protein [Acidimicrobiaceae bacterium]
MTVEFEAVQRPAAMFAEALLGRPVRLEVSDRQPASGRRRLANDDRELVVVLPPSVDAFNDHHLDRRIFRHAVLHQAAYEMFGTRGFDVSRFLARHADRPALEETFTAIEEHRIDAVVRHRFPGAVDDVHRAASLAPPLAPELSVIMATIDRRDDLHRWTVDDAAALALALCPVGERLVPLDANELGPPSSPEHPPPVGGSGADDADGTVESLLLNPIAFAADVEDLPSVEAEGVGVDGDLPEESPRRGPSAGRRRLENAQSGQATRATTTAGEARSFLYDEWDVHAARYLPSWCRVHERPLIGGDPAFISDVRRRHAALARQVRRQFAMITAESWRRLRRERDGAELDLDEVVSTRVDRRRGLNDDEHLHIRRVLAAREVAAAFLLDMSASTSSGVVAAARPQPRLEANEIEYPWLSWDDDRPIIPPERTVMDLAKESLALMCDALQVIGDEHAIYGFSGSGRDNIEFYIAKELTEASSARTWTRLAAMTSRQYTRMGPAIRHATTKLRAHAARTRFLVVVSDGYPQDHDYGPNRNDRSYGIADTAKALEEAERAGVLTFCVTVDPAGHDYLRDMCPDERYLVIDDVNALPGELTKLYRSLVLSRR